MTRRPTDAAGSTGSDAAGAVILGVEQIQKTAGPKAHGTEWPNTEVASEVMRTSKRIGIALLAVAGTSVAYIQVCHRMNHGHFVPPGLHADVAVHNASIGKPGITKLYEGTMHLHKRHRFTGRHGGVQP